jgi:type II secretory pathway component GspD/PulD (secretin)
VKNFRETKDTIPFLNAIPLGDWIFGSRTNNLTDQTLFVFIKPVILRDDKFEDLKFISNRAMGEVGLQSGYPQSWPIPMK